MQLNGEEVLVGKSEIQVLVVLQGGDIGFVQNLPTLFNNLETRSDTERIATLVQPTIRQRPIGTAMTYAMHAASGASAVRRARIENQSHDAIFANAINWGIGDDGFVRALGVPRLAPRFQSNRVCDA